MFYILTDIFIYCVVDIWEEVYTCHTTLFLLKQREDVYLMVGTEFARRLFQKWLSYYYVYTSNTHLEGHLLISMLYCKCDMYIGTALYIVQVRYVHVLYIGTAYTCIYVYLCMYMYIIPTALVMALSVAKFPLMAWSI